MSSEAIPSNLRNYVPYPQTPWRVSPSLYARAKGTLTKSAYTRCEVLPSDPEHDFIYTYFQFSPPPNKHIKRAHVIINHAATNQFEALIPSLEQEARSAVFAPKWHQEDNVPLRKSVIDRFQKATSQFPPIALASLEGQQETYPLTKALPLWHGTQQEICHSICKSGFTFFGKHHYFKDQASGASASKSKDPGFFGSGIYFTNSARYASDIYSDGNLLLTWVSMRAPYPVIADKELPSKPSDMSKLEGFSAYQNYNAHYIPVIPFNPYDPQCLVYYPCSFGTSPILDEYVVFHKTQTLPTFWIELGIDLVMSPSTTQPSLLIEQMLDDILKLLDNLSVKQNPSLHQALEAKADELLDKDQGKPLSSDDLKFHVWAKKLLDDSGKVRDVVQKQFLKAQGTPAAAALSSPQALPPKPPVKQGVPKVAPPVPKAAAVPLLPQGAFGALKWELYFGIKVVEPPLPADIHAILQGPCLIFAGKKVWETHLLTLIPEGMTLEQLETLAQNPRQGNKIGFGYKDSTTWSQHSKTAAIKTHWALVTNDVLPGSRHQSWESQQALVAKFRSQGYEIPSVIDVAASLLLEYVQTGKMFYRDKPLTYTRCKEQVSYGYSQYPLIVGGFAPAGLDVNFHSYGDDHGCVGVGAVRQFC